MSSDLYESIIYGTDRIAAALSNRNESGNPSHLYFGRATAGFLGLPYWRVLTLDRIGGDSALLLLSEYLWEPETKYGADSKWELSDARKWCAEFQKRCLSSCETNALRDVIPLSGPDEVKTGFISRAEAMQFLGSAGESGLVAYRYNILEKPAPGYWWLRSTDPSDNYSAYDVFYDGRINYSDTICRNLARPAVRVGMDSILFISRAKGGKASGKTGSRAMRSVLRKSKSADWKMTLLEPKRCSPAKGFRVSKITSGEGVIKAAYSNAPRPEEGLANEYISAFAADRNGDIKYYGRIVQILPGQSRGTLEIDVSGLELRPGDTLYVYSEQYNGDMCTDYASVPIAIAGEGAAVELPCADTEPVIPVETFNDRQGVTSFAADDSAGQETSEYTKNGRNTDVYEMPLTKRALSVLERMSIRTSHEIDDIGQPGIRGARGCREAELRKISSVMCKLGYEGWDAEDNR